MNQAHVADKGESINVNVLSLNKVGSGHPVNLEDGAADDHEMASTEGGLSRPTNGGVAAEGLYRGAEVLREKTGITSPTDLATGEVSKEQSGVLDLRGDISASVNKNQEASAQTTEGITEIRIEPEMERNNVGELETMDKSLGEQLSDGEISNAPENGGVFDAVENDKKVIATKEELEKAQNNLVEKQKEVGEVMKGIQVLGVSDDSITVLNRELNDCEVAVEKKEVELKNAIIEAKKEAETSKIGGKFEVVIKQGLGPALEKAATKAEPDLTSPEIKRKTNELFEGMIVGIHDKLLQDGMSSSEATDAMRMKIQEWQEGGHTVIVKKDAEGKLTASVIATENKAMKDGAVDDYSYQMAA